MSTSVKIVLTATGPARFVDSLWADHNNVLHLVRKSDDMIELFFTEHSDSIGEIVAAYPELTITSLEYLDGPDSSGTLLSVLSERPAENPIEAAAPARKQYDTPFIPRKLWFKQQRKAGLLPPRQRKTADVVDMKPKRSAKQLAAIRGYYARRNAKKAA
ncbi:hypothetical protein [Microvirga massiliensis]|uniref:hypothetical protein n=1 Tax=Microvirga massiliensis TaxID=1033741 RepID=UPI00062BBE88|nr:hypothetical protein [Microvirga massiliensis]